MLRHRDRWVEAAYFELFPRTEPDDTARTLSLALAAAAAATILLGAGFGRWVSGQVRKAAVVDVDSGGTRSCRR